MSHGGHCWGYNMMTSSNGNIFRVTGPLCGEFTGPRWIPLTKASDAELSCFLWSAPWINGWVNNRDAGDLKRYRGHYDVTVMISVPYHPCQVIATHLKIWFCRCLICKSVEKWVTVNSVTIGLPDNGPGNDQQSDTTRHEVLRLTRPIAISIEMEASPSYRKSDNLECEIRNVKSHKPQNPDYHIIEEDKWIAENIRKMCRTANMSWRTCVVVKQTQSHPIPIF